MLLKKLSKEIRMENLIRLLSVATIELNLSRYREEVHNDEVKINIVKAN